ncbi:MAG: caspase family protein [Anaerolineae bacterium]|nr:caspase family protein [Anaerolineae bacterium]
MSIGINAYHHMPPLVCASKDAQDVAECLIDRFNFPRQQVILLQDELATQENILAAFDTIFNRWNIADDDRLMIFFAGHGITRETSDGGKVGYIAPFDAKPGAWRTLLRMSDLIDQATFLAAKHILFVMDTCYSGLSFLRQAPVDPVVEHFLTRRAIQMMTSGKGTEPVADGGDLENDNSIFTGHLLQALSGDAATASGLMTAGDVMHYVYRHVTRTPKVRQTPQYGWLNGDGDFVFQFPRGKSLPLPLEVSLRQGTAPSRLMAVNELTAIAGDATSDYDQLAMERIEEVARQDPDPRVRYTALRVLGVEPAHQTATKQPDTGPRIKLLPPKKPKLSLRMTWPTALAIWVVAGVAILSLATLFAWQNKAAAIGPQEGSTGISGKIDRQAGTMSTRNVSPETLPSEPPSTLLPDITLPPDLAFTKQILFQDDFISANNKWEPAPNNSQASRYINGDGQMYFGLYKTYGLWVAQPRNLAARDAVISVEATLINGQDDGGYGLIFRQFNFDHYYYFRIGVDGTYTLIVENGGALSTPIPPTPLPSMLIEEVPHQITVHADGNDITLFFDQQKLAAVHSPALSYLRGSMGVVVDTKTSAPIEVTFDNFVAYEP